MEELDMAGERPGNQPVSLLTIDNVKSIGMSPTKNVTTFLSYLVFSALLWNSLQKHNSAFWVLAASTQSPHEGCPV